MAIVLTEALISFTIGEGIKQILKLGGILKKKYQIRRLRSNIIKSLSKVLRSSSIQDYDFQEYFEKFLGISDTKLSDEWYAKDTVDLVKKKFQEKFESPALYDFQDKIQSSLKEGNYYITLHLLKEVYNRDFFYNIFGYPEMTQDHKKLINLIQRVFFEEFLKMIDTEKLAREIYWFYTVDFNEYFANWSADRIDYFNQFVDEIRALGENLSITIKNVLENPAVDEEITKILKKYQLDHLERQIKERSTLHHFLIENDIDSTINNQKISKFSEEQYEQYKKIWKMFLTLKRDADLLWSEVFSWKDLRQFARDLLKIESYLMEESIFIDDKHSEKLNNLLHIFKLYYDGKGTFFLNIYGEKDKKIEKLLTPKKGKEKKLLIEVDIKRDFDKSFLERPLIITPYTKDIIMKNKDFLEQYTSLLHEIKLDFQQKLKNL